MLESPENDENNFAMKILIDARLYGLENAGLGRYIINLIDELVNLDKKNEYVLLLRKKYFKQLDLPENWEKVPTDFRHYSFAEQIKLPGLIKRINPDITHFPHFNVPIFFRGKYIVTIHDILMHKQEGKKATTLPAPLYYFKRIGYRVAFRKAVCGSLKIIVPSKFVKKELADYYGLNKDKVIVAYEGVDSNLIPKGTEKRILKKYKVTKPYLIYAGNAYPHKNLKRAIEAVGQINKEEKKITLLIASARNVFAKRLKGFVAKLNAQTYVKLLGFVPDDELGTLYKSSLAFLYPSLSEGFGLPGMEAIQAGTLVLASDIPVFQEVYEDNVLYFNPLDFSSIAKTIKNAMSMGEKERERRISRSQNFIKRYSWIKMAKKTLETYEDSAFIRQGK